MSATRAAPVACVALLRIVPSVAGQDGTCRLGAAPDERSFHPRNNPRHRFAAFWQAQLVKTNCRLRFADKAASLKISRCSVAPRLVHLVRSSSPGRAARGTSPCSRVASHFSARGAWLERSSIHGWVCRRATMGISRTNSIACRASSRSRGSSERESAPATACQALSTSCSAAASCLLRSLPASVSASGSKPSRSALETRRNSPAPAGWLRSPQFPTGGGDRQTARAKAPDPQVRVRGACRPGLVF